MIQRAVLYARSARAYDPAAQLAALCAHARAQGWIVVAELHEDPQGVSGLDRQPPQLAHTRRLAAQGAYDVLLVRDLTRLSRDACMLAAVCAELRRAGVQIVALHQPPQAALPIYPLGSPGAQP